MDPTNENDMQENLRDLSQAIRHAHLNVSNAETQLRRVLRASFAGGDVVYERFQQLIGNHGADQAVAIAEGRGKLPRLLWLGSLRGGFLSPGARGRAEQNVLEIAAATRELRLAEQARDDLVATHERVASQRPAHDPARHRQVIDTSHIETRGRSRTRKP